jgi:hypothetical protein
MAGTKKSTPAEGPLTRQHIRHVILERRYEKLVKRVVKLEKEKEKGKRHTKTWKAAMLKEKTAHIKEKQRDVAVGNFVVTEIKAIRKLQLKQVKRDEAMVAWLKLL